jgi:hypothetical protein
MENNTISSLSKNFFVKILSFFFITLTIWWVSIYVRGLTEGSENNAFTLIYPWFSLIGAVTGLFVAEKWGGFKSLMGKIICTFSFGLLAQFLGQALYAYYIYIQGIEVPYPSLGDIGYFGSVIFYIIAAIYLAKISGFGLSFKSFKGKFVAIVIPLALLILSYSLFLKGYEYDWSNKLQMFLDFGYPLGQAIYVSIAISAYIMSRDTLGGLLRKPIVFILAALVFQYLCDFTFLYQASRGTWYVGGTNDFMYFVSYFIMTLSLINLGVVFNKIRNS